uniref:hypothetical protein n=1 Tax=uncultured Sphingomonas sp. TaxID=158754 RepID=UPI0025EC781E|nr:hypothetical protein [uncultured Sphingomonas sp.]
MKRNAKLLVGALAAVAVAELYHGPLGAAETLEQRIERQARAELDHHEMFGVQAQLDERPLRRTLVLSGPADDFQRGELVRVMGQLPGVAAVEWDPASLPAQETRR